MIGFGLELTVRTLGDLSPKHIPSLTVAHGLVVVRGLAPLEREAFLGFARETGSELLEWDFGPVMELKERADSPNYLFTREPVPFHWDGAFFEVPSILMFNCIVPPAEGGETLFCDTHRLYSDLTPNQRATLDATELRYVTEKKAHYGGVLRQKVVDRHPVSGAPVLRLGEVVRTTRNPVSRELSQGPAEASSLIDEIDRALYSPKYCLKHRWKAGDLLFADNHGLLHGRRGFQKTSVRHLRRIQLK